MGVPISEVVICTNRVFPVYYSCIIMHPLINTFLYLHMKSMFLLSSGSYGSSWRREDGHL